MGLPLSVVVEIVLQNVKKQTLGTYTKTLPLWLHYIDNTITAMHKDEINAFHKHHKRQKPEMQFTKEIKENGEIPFLDCLVSHHDKLWITVTDTQTDYSTSHPTNPRLTKLRLYELWLDEHN